MPSTAKSICATAKNPHQSGKFYGDFEALFEQIHGKEISYNNLLDIDAAVNLISEFDDTTFAILKHNNACGVASRSTLLQAWKDALAGDPVSAFGGVLIANRPIDEETAAEINKIFFEVIIAPAYSAEALAILEQKKNRIILIQKPTALPAVQYRSILNGMLKQDKDLHKRIYRRFEASNAKGHHARTSGRPAFRQQNRQTQQKQRHSSRQRQTALRKPSGKLPVSTRSNKPSKKQNRSIST